jgi:hypothetical protein
MRSRVHLLIAAATALFGMLMLQGCSGRAQPAAVAPDLPRKVQAEVTPKATASPSVTANRHTYRTPKMKWSFDPGKNGLDNIMVGPDGTIYAASL